MKIQELMTSDVVTVAPTATLKEAAALLVLHNVSGLPVLDGGRVVGVLSERDFLFKERGPNERPRWLLWLTDPIAVSDKAKLDARTVESAMTAPALTVSPSASVAKAAQLMLAADVSRLPVVNGDELVGIVTRADLARAFARPDDEIAHEIVENVVRRGLLLDDNYVHVDVHDGEVVVEADRMRRDDDELMRQLILRVPGVVSVTTHAELV